MDNREYYIGLMSGTSMDAVDAVLVDFSTPFPTLCATHSEPISPLLKSKLQRLNAAERDELHAFGELDTQVGRLFADAVQQLMKQTTIPKHCIRAIGSHGQTVRHQPCTTWPFTLQIGDPNVIATRTGITTIADFRRADLAVGGQGAPLVPAFHQAIFRNVQEDRVILNLGGIANITYLPRNPQQAVIGFDTGHGNTLLDAWIQRHLNQPFDAEGAWAAQGDIDH